MVNIDPTSISTWFGGAGPWVVWILIILCVLGFFGRNWKKISRFVQTIDALGELPEALNKLDTITEELKVLNELRPNHGGSIRDRIQKIHKQMEETQADLKKHIEYCETKPAPRTRKPKTVPSKD